MNKIDPNLIESIPISRDYIRNAKKKQSQDKFHKFKKALQLNVFDLDKNKDQASDTTGDHDIFSNSDIRSDLNNEYMKAGYMMNGRKVQIPIKVNKKRKNHQKSKTTFY